MFNNDSRHYTAWPHAPIHKLSSSGTYFVTCSTYLKQHFFAGPIRTGVVYRGLLLFAKKYGWHLEAWAVFSNHYHFVAHSPANDNTAESLPRMLGHFHTETARWINKTDNAPGRCVWHNFRETELTYQGSYFARLNYTHNNAVKHGLVTDARLYPWCSAAWFESTATPAQVKTILEFKLDRVKIWDEFEPSQDW